MTSRDFCYWLQGFFEIAEQARIKDASGTTPAVAINQDQLQTIRKHLSLVFVHEIDPSAGDAHVQAQLNAIHNPPKISGTDSQGNVVRC